MANYLLHPICYKNIGIPGAAVVTVTAKNNFFTIGAEHGESVKAFIPGNFLLVTAIGIGQVHIEGEPTLVFVVAAENKMIAMSAQKQKKK